MTILNNAFPAIFIVSWTIGTLLRRLELLVESLRTRPAQEGPTVHAFAHALSSCLVYLREALELCPPIMADYDVSLSHLELAAIWSQYGPYYEVLTTLSKLCARDEGVEPSAYPEMKSSPVSLLSQIYEHLERAVEEQSSILTRAVLAFVMTVSSQEYIQRVSHAVGFGGRLQQAKARATRESADDYVIDLEDNGEEEDIFALMDKVDERFPSFFPRALRRILPSAQRSLILINIAQVSHASLGDSAIPQPRWVWTDGAVAALWNGRHPLPPSSKAGVSDATPPSTNVYRPEFSSFGLFEMEPGTSKSQSALQVKDDSFRILTSFINSFPNKLPSITPTLPQLTSLIFRDLTHHARTLSSTLLDHFLDSDGILNFPSHLLVLRSFLLLSVPSFKNRLVAALLSDDGEYEVDNTPHPMSIRYFRRPKERKSSQGNQPWAVGISPNLLDREQWPPIGTDLSFFLRTVIVDALEEENSHHRRGDNSSQSETEDSWKTGRKDQIMEEASWRLGFAIRHLPSGTGKEKWLDPLAIEALDFLYMDYKPPHPLEILISPDVLSKYQRMFAFLLRLLRVECAIKSLFRMTTHRTMEKFLFPTFSASRKLLLHFRFVAQSFVSALSSYVFDTVIGGNFDSFFARLSAQRSESPPTGRRVQGEDDPSTQRHQRRFADVFELENAHSALLDDILSACLLRSSQRALSDLLRQALGIVLDLAVLIGELYRERQQEYRVAADLEPLYFKFRSKMTLLTSGLKKMTASVAAADAMASGTRTIKVGGQDALYQLLVKLDFGEWWTNGIPKTTEAP